MSKNLPTSLSDIAEVQAAEAKYQKACEQHQQAAAEYVRLNAQLNDGANTGDGLSALAERALNGEPLGALCGDAVALVGKIADARQACRICEVAEKLAHDRLTATRKDALQKVIPGVKTAYTAHARRIGDLLVDLVRAAQAETAFRAQYDSSSALSLIPRYIPSAVLPGISNARIGSYLKEMVQADLLPQRTLADFEALVPQWPIS